MDTKHLKYEYPRHIFVSVKQKKKKKENTQSMTTENDLMSNINLPIENSNIYVNFQDDQHMVQFDIKC